MEIDQMFSPLLPIPSFPPFLTVTRVTDDIRLYH
jgi:hypothetical protein